MKIGSDNIGSLYLGADKIGKAYLVSELVYNANTLPYTPLTWVGSTGAESSTVCFNLGINLLSTMTFEFDVHPTTDKWGPVIQASAPSRPMWAQDSNQLYIYRNQTNGFDFLYFGGTSLDKQRGLTGRHTFKLNGGLWVDSTKVYNISSPKSVASGGSIWIDGYKIYGFKLWDNGVLIADLIPALYQGTYGLWDTVNDTFIQKISGNITGA